MWGSSVDEVKSHATGSGSVAMNADFDTVDPMSILRDKLLGRKVRLRFDLSVRLPHSAIGSEDSIAKELLERILNYV